MKRLKSLKSLRIGDLKISLPIVQGGMGVGISLSGLASAVANEGGVGVISSAGLGLLYRRLSPDYCKASILGLKEELRKARERTRGVIGVNVMVAMSNFADMVRTSIAERACRSTCPRISTAVPARNWSRSSPPSALSG